MKNRVSELKVMRQFFEDSPALYPNSIGLEAGMSPGELNKILSGKNTLTWKKWLQIIPVLEKYGFKYELKTMLTKKPKSSINN